MDFRRDWVAARAAALAADGIYVGTSSWKYEGWLGALYDPARYTTRGKVAKTRFERDCLSEYAEVFKTVSVDAGYYFFPAEKYLANLAAAVPDDFRFCFKVTDEITARRFPRIARYGDRAGKANENFLNARLFKSAFLGPMRKLLPKVGILMFEFSHFGPSDFARGRDFVDVLDRFLGELPTRAWQFGVEIRNETFLVSEYFEMLARHGVAHVFNNWTRMPPVARQVELEGAFTADHFAARFLLKPGRTYEEAVKAFAPYKEAQEVDTEARDALARLLKRKPKGAGYLLVNNRLEGCALQTIREVLEAENSGHAQASGEAGYGQGAGNPPSAPVQTVCDSDGTPSSPPPESGKTEAQQIIVIKRYRPTNADHKFRKRMREAAEHRCAACSRQDPLTSQAHHILPTNRYPHLAREPLNVLVLCGECHGKISGAEQMAGGLVLKFYAELPEQIRLHHLGLIERYASKATIDAFRVGDVERWRDVVIKAWTR
ncbi:MAG: DUF72 domain-containing protein [Candidatus Methylacidiphilales bacterium]|nr:DUF72 domain-containing protein [Candidatus Methylacidiphilales bacterium]